jgi:hypothetical protein
MAPRLEPVDLIVPAKLGDFFPKFPEINWSAVDDRDGDLGVTLLEVVHCQLLKKVDLGSGSGFE